MFKLGIIGPGDLVERSLNIAAEFEVISCTGIPYKNEDETFELVRENEANLDGFLFTGYIPYYRVLSRKMTSKPLLYYPITGVSLHRVLFIAKVHDGIDIEKVSIDSLSRDEVFEVYKQFMLDSSRIHIDEKDLSQFDHGRLVSYHKDLYKSGASECAFTAVNSVYESLLKENIPAYRVLPTTFTIRETFRLVRAAGETYAAENIQIIMQIIDIENYNTPDRKHTLIEKREKKLELYHELLDYGKKYQACIFPSEGDEFLMLITKGVFQKYSNFYEDIPIISHVQEKLGIAVSMGVGMGRSALEAEENAREALILSKKDVNLHAYIINQDKEVWGPIGSGRKLQYSLKSDNREMVQLADKTTLSITTLTRLKDLVSRLNRETISSFDIQEGLGVTLRTANRIINKLYAAGAVENVGLEQPVYRGRPRQLYKVNFNKYKS